MALRLRDNVRQAIAQDLYAFFEPHGTTATQFDEWCSWTAGSTQALLDRTRDPSDRELMEICVRLNHSLALYVASGAAVDTTYVTVPPLQKCSAADPCCDHRLQFLPDDLNEPPFQCPADCLCHS